MIRNCSCGSLICPEYDQPINGSSMCKGLLPAAPAVMAADGQLHCDFCNVVVSPGPYFSEGSPDFKVYFKGIGEDALELPVFGSQGDFCSCPACHDLVLAEEFEDMIARVLSSCPLEWCGENGHSLVYEVFLRTCYSIVFGRDLVQPYEGDFAFAVDLPYGSRIPKQWVCVVSSDCA